MKFGKLRQDNSFYTNKDKSTLIEFWKKHHTSLLKNETFCQTFCQKASATEAEAEAEGKKAAAFGQSFGLQSTPDPPTLARSQLKQAYAAQTALAKNL